MIGMRSLAALALASVASFTAACSSSSGSGGSATTFACADNQSMTPSSADSACISCVQSHCSSQATAAYGSGYADENFSGGACGSYITCIAPCACNDTACAEKCATALESNTACQMASETAGTCIDANCSTQCNAGSSSGGTSSSSGSSGGTTTSSSSGTSSGSGSGGACNQSSSSLCIQKGEGGSLCTEGGGTPVSTCPTAGLAGCCTISGIEECDYSPETASDVMMGCTEAGGTFSATP
jgi:hypothetical protein